MNDSFRFVSFSLNFAYDLVSVWILCFALARSRSSTMPAKIIVFCSFRNSRFYFALSVNVCLRVWRSMRVLCAIQSGQYNQQSRTNNSSLFISFHCECNSFSRFSHDAFTTPHYDCHTQKFTHIMLHYTLVDRFFSRLLEIWKSVCFTRRILVRFSRNICISEMKSVVKVAVKHTAKYVWADKMNWELASRSQSRWLFIVFRYKIIFAYRAFIHSIRQFFCFSHSSSLISCRGFLTLCFVLRFFFHHIG